MLATDFLYTLLSLSISGTALAGVVWLCRKVFARKLSCAAKYYLWILVLLRLVLPIGLPGSLMETTAVWMSHAATQYWETAVPNTVGEGGAIATPPTANEQPGDLLSDQGITDEPVTFPHAELLPAETQSTANMEAPKQNTVPAATELLPYGIFVVWTAGAVFCLARDLIAYQKLRNLLKAESLPVDPEDLTVFRQMYGQTDGWFRVRLVCSTATTTPMLLGILRPVLVLPAHNYCKQSESGMLRLLLRHEMTHYRRHDLWYKWFLLTVRSVHWFNPVMPLLLQVVNEDCERACDEAVTQGMSPAQRRSYGSALLAHVGTSGLPAGAAATTLAGNEKEILRRRLNGILTPHKSSVGTAILTIALTLLLVGCGAALGVAGLTVQADKAPALSGSTDADNANIPQQNESDAPARTDAPIPESDDTLVTVRDYIPNLYVDLKYATADNLTGMPLYDFTEPQLRYGTVKKLTAAQHQLNAQGYSLKIWDAYRPMETHQALWEACPDPAYVSNPTTGYLGHSRGNTVDVTLVTLDGKELAMPSGFDQFDARADRDYSDVSTEAAKHATLLQQAMEDAGFVSYAAEWSHYYDSTEYDIIPAADSSRITASDAYAALLAGDRSLLAAEDATAWWIPAFGTDGLDYEYAYLDLDRDGSDELLVQMVDDPAGYNGVFHFKNGQLRCWNSDAAEGSCRDYPLRNGTMVRQYDQNGSCSYTLFRYTSSGEVEPIALLFAREEALTGSDPLPVPYYEVNGVEVTRTRFEAQLVVQITDQIPEQAFWNAL